MGATQDDLPEPGRTIGMCFAKLNEYEIGLILGMPEAAIVALKRNERSLSGTPVHVFQPLFEAVTTLPAGGIHHFLEEALKRPGLRDPDRKALAVIVGKLGLVGGTTLRD